MGFERSRKHKERFRAQHAVPLQMLKFLRRGIACYAHETLAVNEPSSQHDQGNGAVQGHEDGPHDAGVKQDQDEDEPHRL